MDIKYSPQNSCNRFAKPLIFGRRNSLVFERILFLTQYGIGNTNCAILLI